MIVPAQPNVQQIKLGEYAPRKPSQYFYVPSTGPEPEEKRGGCKYYEVQEAFDKFMVDARISKSLVFSRSAIDRKKQFERIEQMRKTIRTDFDYEGRLKKTALKRKIASENKEIMFNLMFGQALKQ